MTTGANGKDLERTTFGSWLGVKGNFLILAMVGVGVLPGAVVALWLRLTEGVPNLFMAFVVALFIGGGYVWGQVMWRFFEFKRRQWAARRGNDV